MCSIDWYHCACVCWPNGTGVNRRLDFESFVVRKMIDIIVTNLIVAEKACIFR